ncbi:unnamed protein product [Hymenolepis diminuta]|uniref:Uncharacterized protein n=1 Tax=Hymenolepis diminuta TaxID=6216 RepID=A0A564Y1R1_HYMDI|nr:unnamed protein product [Hymenolepis diminuta]
MDEGSRRPREKFSTADLLHTARIAMLLRESNRSDHCLCSSYCQPLDPLHLTYSKMINKLKKMHGYYGR